jgi:hypothetical protein
MSKFLLIFLVQISKALVNSKIQFLIQNLSSSLSARPPLPAHSAFGYAGPRWPLFSRKSKPTGRPKPLSPHVSLA